MQFQVQGSSKNKVTNTVMPSTLLWLQCMHRMWVAAGKYQICSQQHWHCSICPTMGPRFISYCKGNQCQEVTDSCWHLLQTAYQSGASKGRSLKRWKSLVPIPPWTCDWLGHYDWEVVDHFPSGYDLVLSHIELVGLLQECLAGKWFETHADVKQSVISWITIVTDFLYIRIQALVPQWDRCSKING
jgi:hypothetical protein